MPKLWKVSATEVKNAWGRVVRRVLKKREPALVENKGAATVVILPADDYLRLVARGEGRIRKREELALLQEAERFAKEVARRHEGRPVPDSVEILRQMREERDEEILGLR